MTEQTLTPIVSSVDIVMEKILEDARKAHERFLIKQQDCDLEKAIECYIDAIKINPCDIDVCYIPGLLFDKRGIRLGHGGGYYDRLLVKLSPDTPVIGLSFPWQLVEELPFEAHDIPCCKVITKDR
jgi:5,10-methenyltetrahydrofolate synthetase